MRKNSITVLQNNAYLQTRRIKTVSTTDDYAKIVKLNSDNDKVICELGFNSNIVCLQDKDKGKDEDEDKDKEPSILKKRMQWHINKIYKDHRCIEDEFLSFRVRPVSGVEFTVLKKNRDILIKTSQCLHAKHRYYQDPSEKTSKAWRDACERVRQHMIGNTIFSSNCKPSVKDSARRLDIVATDEEKRKKAADQLTRERRVARTKLVEKRLQKELKGVALGFGFEFRMTDKDSSSLGLDFSIPLSKGSFALGIALSEEKTRANTRQFDLAEDVAHLMADGATCEMRSSNWRYPLTGEIGLVEAVKAFLSLAKIEGFFKERKKTEKEGERGASAKAEDFTDTLEFTTEVSGGPSPILSLNPIANHFRLVKATPKTSGSRKDVHKLTITFVKRDDSDEKLRDTIYAVDEGPSAVSRALAILKEKRSDDMLRKVIREELRLP
jgi:hypothetical protein